MKTYMPTNWKNLEEIDKFLETHNVTRLNHEEIQNPYRPITSKDTESVIKNLPTGLPWWRSG